MQSFHYSSKISCQVNRDDFLNYCVRQIENEMEIQGKQQTMYETYFKGEKKKQNKLAENVFNSPDIYELIHLNLKK